MQKQRSINLDLLRVIAIISVIFYHAKLNIPYIPFSNGYLGVDIFFFLSGYLLTTIYKKEDNKYSIINFLKKRILRIFPCYLLVCIVVLIFSFFYYLPYPYKNIALETLSSLLFVSNYYYSLTSFNYGAEPALLKALLHTWTLSLEIQVYLILALLYKIKNRRLLFNCFLILTIISLYLFINRQFNLNNNTYYLTELRLWQFLFGAILAFIPRIELKKFISKYFTIIWLRFFKLQIPFLIRHRNVFEDLETWIVWGNIALNQQDQMRKARDKDLLFENVRSGNYYSNMASYKIARGINASSIADISQIPRATVIRKLKWLVKKDIIRKNKNLEYQLKNSGKIYEVISKNTVINQEAVADFLTDVFDYMKNSNFKL